jgi:anthranilate phosphoribosyltransferase
MDAFKPVIAKVANNESLGRAEAEAAFDALLSGDVTPAQMGGFLMALRVRGETVDEITGAVETMRAKMTRVEGCTKALDIVGTGGDQSGTYNISTCAAFVAAGAGLKIAKHGNRALSSKSGAADVLMALGVNIELAPDRIAQCVDAAGVGFMFAPAHHAAMRHVGPSRVELGTRTIFNLLGPLSNPAGVKRQVIGCFSKAWIEPMARVLGQLGSTSVWVTHGEGGLDEITPAGVTFVAQLKDGKVTAFEITPESAGVTRGSLADLKGGDAAHNAAALRDVLSAKPGAYADAAAMTAGAALLVAGKAATLKEGVTAARKAIASGAAQRALDTLVAVSNG